MDVSIIIVNYNTKDLTRNCLKSVFEQTDGIDFEVIVSDNGSTDGSVGMIKSEFPQAILIENNANLGFGAANNRGAAVAKGKYVFYLNSDTLLLNNAVKIFFDYWENADDKATIGALGCNLLDKELKTTHSFGKFPSARNTIKFYSMQIIKFDMKRFFRLLGYDYTRHRKKPVYSYYEGEVDYITGADLFLLNNDSARFDERYFLYSEETQLEYNLAQNDLRRLIIDGPKIIHLQGESDEKFENDLQSYVTFGKIQMDISKVRFLKYNISKFTAEICKILILFLWSKKINRKKTKPFWVTLKEI